MYVVGLNEDGVIGLHIRLLHTTPLFGNFGRPLFSYTPERTHAIMCYMLEPKGNNMAQPQILEGIWEEILTHNAAQLAGRMVKIYFDAEDERDAPTFPPNEKALAALRQIAKMKEGMRETDGSQTDRIIREGRAGGMYSDDATE
jgi:hypothetical protein